MRQKKPVLVRTTGVCVCVDGWLKGGEGGYRKTRHGRHLHRPHPHRQPRLQLCRKRALPVFLLHKQRSTSYIGKRQARNSRIGPLRMYVSVCVCVCARGSSVCVRVGVHTWVLSNPNKQSQPSSSSVSDFSSSSSSPHRASITVNNEIGWRYRR